ncbi:flagellar basal body-associated protein FliL [Salipaludibacillus agaradhaerens]|jgi:flagellar FliL protein|uniref:Flagellar protein FliL n=1 Tax=Salipaludibacillus agaradhaerens TaxID=76935 RepID=A0A9Q4B0S0_SALAG|nr:flagellar basal body-associated protein FliL [Salipaludibacillus agaradhaerens]UJW58144.1 flagellar basal body-associated protein FliL [Bacillus sp. A116_S68]MCR6096050.1 flagellar basal body-associated protein FliL [Salipaludibacillus agaradhaerens]MCR6107062.1 flagellar basal body-associated protein FliL [Salipaludibacillus agaradhaerens]MCR6114391.1 flagellar basal body-associated protein FliL [Salipaludibacillus agaradhaerens]MCR6119093.1 flagellar basal body-associated protein FliL [Sa
MFANRLVNIMLIVLAALTLIGVLTLVLYTQFFQESDAEEGEPTIDQVLERSVETEEITTNLSSNNIIRSQYVIQLENNDAKKEFEKRSFQVENIIIQELSDMTATDFQGSAGIQGLEDRIKNRINEIMQDGEVVQVYMNQRVIQ